MLLIQVDILRCGIRETRDSDGVVKIFWILASNSAGNCFASYFSRVKAFEISPEFLFTHIFPSLLKLTRLRMRARNTRSSALFRGFSFFFRSFTLSLHALVLCHFCARCVTKKMLILAARGLQFTFIIYGNEINFGGTFWKIILIFVLILKCIMHSGTVGILDST